MTRAFAQAQLPMPLEAVVTEGCQVRLSDGRTGFIKRLSSGGDIELVRADGAFLCISHVACVRAVLPACSSKAAGAAARSSVEDGRDGALGIPALNPDSFRLRRRAVGRSHG